MPDILVGVLLGAVGLYVCFAGLRTFLIVLPVIGFISGFFIGAAGVRTFIGEGFLGSVTGVIVGLLVGLLLLINQVDGADLGYGLAWATIEESWLWLIAWLALTVAGMFAQLNSISDITLPEDRWASAHAA